MVAIAPQDILFGFARIVDLTRGENAQWRVYVARTVDEAIAWLEEELPDLDFAEARQRAGIGAVGPAYCGIQTRSVFTSRLFSALGVCRA